MTVCRRTRRASVAVALTAALVAASALPSASSPSFLWKITGQHGALFLAGSVHALSSGYYPLSPAYETAFAASDLLVEEVNFDEALAPEAQLRVLALSMLPGSARLDQVVTPATFMAVTRRAGELGLPVEPLRRFKPWALALTLLGMQWEDTDFDPALGLDRHLHDRARADGKPVHALETLEFQISRLDGLGPGDQDRFLASAARDPEAQTRLLVELADAWKAGDPDTVERVVVAELMQEPRLYARLLVDRNLDWMPHIDALLAGDRTAFVVVGAAHLVGPDGLLALLRNKGYRIEQM
jgi:uncharacterized protein